MKLAEGNNVYKRFFYKGTRESCCAQGVEKKLLPNLDNLKVGFCLHSESPAVPGIFILF